LAHRDPPRSQVVNPDAKAKIVTVAEHMNIAQDLLKSHVNQVQLKNGTWIDKVQLVGNRDKGVSKESVTPKIYDPSSAEYKIYLAEKAMLADIHSVKMLAVEKTLKKQKPLTLIEHFAAFAAYIFPNSFVFYLICSVAYDFSLSRNAIRFTSFIRAVNISEFWFRSSSSH
jgi:hypothetical protein